MEATVQESPYFDYTQAATYCNLDKSTIWRAVRSGALKASGPGRAIRFHRSDLDAWMRSRSR
jgi:excisionase family DNA binding protein